MSNQGGSSRSVLLGVLSWSWVGAPLVWGLYELVLKIPALFTS
jgi:hypothetical protein